MTVERVPRTLLWLLLVYGLASLVHFVHNAEYLEYYPNLPSWLSRGQIYAVWFGITPIGFDGLLHYGRAPLTAHTAAMNFSVLFEVAAAAALVAYTVRLMTRRGVQRGAVHEGPE